MKTIMTSLALRCFFFLLFSLQFHLIIPKKSKVDSFITENLNELNIKSFKCKSSKVPYLMSLQAVSVEKTLYCSFNMLNNNRDVADEKQLVWMLVHNIYKEKKLTKKSNFALKQSTSINKRVHLKKDWYFLGPFQIGKPELDGNPIESLQLENVIANRWNSKFYLYSELANSGVLKWTNVQSVSDNTINIQPPVDWNDLVMSLQSVAVTEWQGVLVNEFVILSDKTEILVQCLGVNLFYIDEFIVNGDIYHRSQYWYPMLLDTGIHIIKVPVRAKGQLSVQCSVQAKKEKQILLHHATFVPDLIDGNWFSFYGAISATNLNLYKSIDVTDVHVKGTDMDHEIGVQLVDKSSFHPGQVNSFIFKFIPSGKKINNKCQQTSYTVTLTFEFSNGERKESAVSLRCRSSDQSFLFTFIDHDGSVQHAAAIKPLKPCLLDGCPVLLTMHGTGVKAENQADSYKRMVKKKFLFGVEKLWLLAPTRFGAHNWEGPGELTAMEALNSLAMLTKNAQWLNREHADNDKVVFAGHSMGGHGAWQVSIHNPDKALAVISAAGWLSKEDYGDSNLLYAHDISISHTDPIVKAIQESCVAENHADKHASNLKGIPVMIRIGADDKTVHPYFSRRMFRLLKEYNVNVTYKEFPGKQHWWWDTKSENDGGVTNDVLIRNFATYSVHELEHDNKKECNADGCKQSATTSKYAHRQESRSSGVYTFVVYNPASFNGGRGVKVMQQTIPFRVSRYTIKIDQSEVDITTTNIQSLLLYEPKIGNIGWRSKTITLDGTIMDNLEGDAPWRFCLSEDLSFKVCDAPIIDFESSEIRGPKNYGPARRIAENPFVIIVCDDGDERDRKLLKNSAVFLANLFLLTSDARTNIYSYKDITEEEMKQKNVIMLGTESCTQHMKLKKLIIFKNNSLTLGNCEFDGDDLSAMYILPHSGNKLLMLLTGHTAQSIHKHVMALSVPTIPPMTRSPFSNLLPDYAIVSNEVLKKGPGGYTCTGFWNNYWRYDAATSSCAC